MRIEDTGGIRTAASPRSMSDIKSLSSTITIEMRFWAMDYRQYELKKINAATARKIPNNIHLIPPISARRAW